MIILGIDPGLATLGYGVIESNGDRRRMIQYGTLTTPPREPMPQRLRAIFQGVNQLMDIYQPDDVAFEELFFSKNITPMQIKQAVTGYGGADKHQVQQMVRLLLNMKEIARPDDAADALAVALTHANSANAKHLFKIQ